MRNDVTLSEAVYFSISSIAHDAPAVRDARIAAHVARREARRLETREALQAWSDALAGVMHAMGSR